MYYKTYIYIYSRSSCNLLLDIEKNFTQVLKAILHVTNSSVLHSTI